MSELEIRMYAIARTQIHPSVRIRWRGIGPACSGLESDGGGATTAAGVADADLVRVGDFFGLPAFTHPDVKPGIVGIVSAGEVTATITGTAPQRPKADPKEVHSCHADCPCQSGGEPLRDFVAPVPHTEGEK